MKRKLPDLPFVKTITPIEHERIAKARVVDYEFWPQYQTFEVDEEAINDARAFLGLKLPVETVLVDGMGHIGMFTCTSDHQVAYKDDRHTIALRSGIPDDMVCETIMHELIHAAQAEAMCARGTKFLAAISPYYSWGSVYFEHPVELQAVGGEWIGKAMRLAKPLGNFKLNKPKISFDMKDLSFRKTLEVEPVRWYDDAKPFDLRAISKTFREALDSGGGF